MRATWDKTFFDSPNPICSYWAGYLAADGCVLNRKGAYLLKVTSIDDYLIDTFKQDTQCTSNISLETKKYKDKIYTIKNLIIQNINDSWYLPLNKIYGLHPRKTFSLEPPKLDLPNSLAYIKGYIDGDGCVSYHMRPSRTALSLTINILGRECMLNWMIETINKVTKADVQCFPRNKIFSVNFVRSTAKNISDVLKDVVDRGMPRKWDKFKNFNKIEAYNKLPPKERKEIGLVNFRDSLLTGDVI